MKKKSILFLAFWQLSVVIFFGQVSKMDSLLNILKTAQEDTNKVNILFQLSEECLVEDILKYAEPALVLGEKLNFKRGVADASNNIGFVYQQQGDLTKAGVYFQKALKIQEEINYKQGIANSLVNLGTNYKQQGDITKALDYYHKGIKIQEVINDKLGEAITLNNIGTIYTLQKDFTNALDYYFKSLKIYEQINNKQGIALLFNNLGAIYQNQENILKALEFYHNALKIQEEIENKQGIAQSLNNIGIIYDNKGDFSKALEYYYKSLSIREAINNKPGIAYSLNALGGIYQKQKKYKDAESFSKRSLQIARDIGFIINIRAASKRLSEIYSEQGKYKDAFQMHRLFKQMADSVNNVETKKSMMKQQIQYEFDKKESLARAEQDKKDAIAVEEKQKQKVITYSISIGLLLVLLLALFIFKGYRQKQKSNEIIISQKALVEEKQKEIIDSINYAKRIQYSLLANDDSLKQNLNQHFVLFKPKDIVSGDFYWAFEKTLSSHSENDLQDSVFYLAICDSTGHGVPGAFMSLLNISFLNEAIIEKRIDQPDEILNHVRKRLIENISQTGAQDGMDGIVICFDKKKITYSAAYNAPLLIRGNSIIYLPADKMPIGQGVKNIPFSLHTIDTQIGDMLYFFTDGYADQFGGIKGKKFKYKQLEELLVSINQFQMGEQKLILENTIQNWKGSIEQVDDILVVGIRV